MESIAESKSSTARVSQLSATRQYVLLFSTSLQMSNWEAPNATEKMEMANTRKAINSGTTEINGFSESIANS
ncbi:MAG: hypothetical protein RIF33_05845 [Cyclobacteriaceae bacterium]